MGMPIVEVMVGGRDARERQIVVRALATANVYRSSSVREMLVVEGHNKKPEHLEDSLQFIAFLPEKR